MSIRASASAKLIDPEEMLPLVGYSDVERVPTGVRDGLYASAVHLRGGGGGLIIVSLDLLTIDPWGLKKIRKGVFDATATQAQHLFLGTTQTHSAPATSRCLRAFGDPAYCDVSSDYLDHVVDQTVAAASEATGTSQPASVAMLELDHPHTGAMLVREDSSGKIMAVIIVHEDTPHYLGRQNKELSADFVAAVRNQLAARFGGSPVVCFFPSPQGNRKLLDYEKDAERGDADEAGRALADLIVSKTKELKKSDFTSNVELAGELTSVPALMRRHLPTVQEAGLKVLTARQDREEQFSGDMKPEDMMNINWMLKSAVNSLGFSMAREKGDVWNDLQDDYVNFQIQKVTIGDMCLLGMPCTLTNECAEHIAGLSDKRVWIAECVNGDMEGGILAVEGENADVCGLLSPIFNVENGQPLLDAAIDMVK